MSTVYTTPGQALKTMGRVLFALILREASNRYGKLKIGYVWAFLEPILFVTVLSVLFTYVRSLQSGDMPEILFYTTGILPFFLFRNIVTQCLTAIQANFQLLAFPQVQVFDLIIARALLELLTYIVVFVVFVSMVHIAEVNTVNIDDMLVVFEALFLIFLLGLGVGAGTAALVPLFPSIQFLVQGVVLRPLLFISGVFFTVDIMPEGIRNLALINPMLQLIEWFRSGFFTEFESEFVDKSYVYGFVLTTMFLGLLIQRALKRYALRVPV